MDARERRDVHDLFVRLADGDRSVLHPAFARVAPLVHSYCARALGGAPESADTAQEALVRVFANVEELDSSRDAVAWIIGIAAWECRTTRRKRSRSREQGGRDEEAMICGRPSPEDAAIEQDLLAAAADVLGAMNASDREAIAEALTGQRGAGPTLRKRLSRALERMRAEWRRRYE